MKYKDYGTKGQGFLDRKGKRGTNMATSSITDNFTITKPKEAGAFADALDRASRAPAARRRVAVGRRVVGRDALREFLSQAKRKK